MSIKVPFYPNHPDKMHCSQAVFRSLLAYYCDEYLSWDEIDALTKTVPGRGSWTMAAHMALAKKGIEVVNIEPFDYAKYYQEGNLYLKANFEPNTVKYYLEKSNLESVKEDIPIFLKLVRHETRKASITDIDRLLDEGYLVGSEINSRVLNSLKGFSLHYVLIIGRDEYAYYINDPGGGSAPPLENRRVKKTMFIQALGGEQTNGEVSGWRRRWPAR
jgi:hypothetical protein